MRGGGREGGAQHKMPSTSQKEDTAKGRGATPKHCEARKSMPQRGRAQHKNTAISEKEDAPKGRGTAKQNAFKSKRGCSKAEGRRTKTLPLSQREDAAKGRDNAKQNAIKSERGCSKGKGRNANTAISEKEDTANGEAHLRSCEWVCKKSRKSCASSDSERGTLQTKEAN